MKIKLSLEEKAELESRQAREHNGRTNDQIRSTLSIIEGWGLTQIAQALLVSITGALDYLSDFISNNYLFSPQKRDLSHRKLREKSIQTPTNSPLNKAAKNKKELNETFLENIAKNVNATLWLAAPDISEVYYMSPNFAAIYDMTFDDFKKNPSELKKRIHPEDLAKWEQAFSLPQALEHTKLSFRYLKNDGMWHYLTAYRSFIFDEKQAPVKVAGVTIDDTELYNAKEKILAQKEELSLTNMNLKKANESLENFTMIACHDLAQPLRIIKAIIEIFKSSDSITDGKYGKDLLLPLEEAISRMKELIDEIGKIALEGGGSSTEYIDVERLLNEKIEPLLLTEFSSAIIKKSSLHPLNTSKELVFLLFKNIIENSIKYNDNIPIIKIRSKKLRTGIVYSITDNGIGIPKDAQKEIFKAGMRLNEKTGAEGLGIGLAGCEKMMTLYNGKMWVHSKAGQGSTFYLFFPTS